jgi:hypothetical protein
MKIEVVQVCRRPTWPLWAVLLVLGWMALGAVAVLLITHFDKSLELCLIKRFTGVPCPTCGFTRGLLSLLHGDIIRAWLYNPLLFTVLTIFFTSVVFHILFARSVRIHLTKTERRITWTLSFILLLANWVYVILFVG